MATEIRQSNRDWSDTFRERSVDGSRAHNQFHAECGHDAHARWIEVESNATLRFVPKCRFGHLVSAGITLSFIKSPSTSFTSIVALASIFLGRTPFIFPLPVAFKVDAV